MTPTLYPSLAETLELHKNLINRFGGEPGVRDLGLLESALMRPQTGYYKSLSMEAAALMQSLMQNHAFVDGNKRVAFACTAIFLRINGYKLKVSANDGESFIIQKIIKQKADIQTITEWLESHMVHI